MQTVETTFKLSYSEEQYQKAIDYIDDMKKHPQRVFWVGKLGKSDEELVYSHIAHKILSFDEDKDFILDLHAIVSFDCKFWCWLVYRILCFSSTRLQAGLIV